jgi:hypothetical protein
MIVYQNVWSGVIYNASAFFELAHKPAMIRGNLNFKSTSTVN